MISRYSPIRETFQSNDIVLVNPLSTLAVPPADLVIPDAPSYHVDSFLYDGQGVSGARGKFNKRDLPHIVGIGMFCNMGDCVVDIGAHGYQTDASDGLFLEIQLQAYNSSNALLLALTPTILQRFNVLNAIFDFDIYMRDFITPAYVPGTTAYDNTDHLRILCRVQGTARYSTILMDEAFQTKRFSMWPEVVIEHTLDMLGDPIT